MGRFKGRFALKVKVRVDKTESERIRFPRLIIQSGIFGDTQHYAKNITAQGIYAVLNNGGRGNGKFAGTSIPARPALATLHSYVAGNTNEFVKIYLENRKDIYSAGVKIGTIINNEHKRILYAWSDPPNGWRTVEFKGFNDPFRHTGTLIKSIAFSINGKGRFGKG